MGCKALRGGVTAVRPGFNRSTQHLDSSSREEDVADEAKIENTSHQTTKSAVVGMKSASKSTVVQNLFNPGGHLVWAEHYQNLRVGLGAQWSMAIA